MNVRSYTAADAGKWDETVGRSLTGTFLHTRRFLSYHGARFEDLSVLCEDADGRCIGVFPAARKPGDAACVASHPGATYGGLAWEPGATAGDVEAMTSGIVEHYRSKGFERLEYRSVPPHLHATCSQADVHALWKRGGEIVRRDLWSVAPLREPAGYSNHHKREIARAGKRDIATGTAASDAEYREFHVVLAACLAERYAASPVHTPEEMIELRTRFPREIALWLARDGSGVVVAGCWVFLFEGRAWHTQYIATSPVGRSQGAGYLVIDGIMREAMVRGVPCLSFGASTEEDGRMVNTGLLEFKSGFGAGALCHDTWRVRLKE